MYKKTNPQQSLFGVEFQLPSSLKARLEKSWAHLFRVEVLPVLLKSEDSFSTLYGTTGRPNFSAARMLSLCLLQELYDFSDQQALDTFGFDVRWHYALNVIPQDAYLSRRSLVEFRRRIAEKDPEMTIVRTIFEDISKAAIQQLGLSTSEQRVDSTHITSNIRNRGRLDLFRKTIELFLNSLSEKDFSGIPADIKEWYQNKPDGWFGMCQAQSSAKLEQLARYLYDLVIRFENDLEITSNEPYQLLVRLLSEQCKLIDTPGQADNGVEDNRVEIKKKTEGETLQSPYDPDASFGHKGKGYSAHITETCNNKGKSEIITDYEVHGAARSDIGKAKDVLQRLKSVGLKPETLFADGGYPSVPSAYEVTEDCVDFMAPVNRSRLSDDMIGRDQFQFDKDGLVLCCPAQHKPIDHRMRSANNQKGSSLHAIFNGDNCRVCSKLNLCPVRAPNNRKRGCKPQDTVGNFRLEITPQLILRDKMFAEQQSEHWKERYKIRSGVEATMSELKRTHGIGKLRVRRLPRVHFAVACKVIACNVKRWAKGYAAGPYYRVYCLFRHVFGHVFGLFWELSEIRGRELAFLV
ncbi:MAG: transposase [Desulfurivibrionaceae bacterium]